ncbi:MAG: hypothetical protein AAF851_05695 [Myxococcota bacterium]
MPTLERDDIRKELRRGVAGAVRVWPRSPATAATFVVQDRDGTELQGSAVANVGQDGGRTFIDCGITTAATSENRESCQVQVAWDNDGFHVEVFDVVAWPLEADVSLDDILLEHPEAGRIVEHLGGQVSMTRDEYGEVLRHRALVQLDGMIRDQVAEDETSAFGDAESWPAHGRRRRFLRGALILNRVTLRRPLLLVALRELYRSASSGRDEETDPNARMAQRFDRDLKAAWSRVSRFEYDLDGDLVSDLKIQPPSIGFAPPRGVVP